MSLLTNRMAEPRMRTDDRLSTIVISTGALDDLIVFWQDGLITIVSLVQPSHMTKSQVFAKQFSSNKNSFIVFAENSESIFVLRLVVHLGTLKLWWLGQKVTKSWHLGQFLLDQLEESWKIEDSSVSVVDLEKSTDYLHPHADNRKAMARKETCFLSTVLNLEEHVLDLPRWTWWYNGVKTW